MIIVLFASLLVYAVYSYAILAIQGPAPATSPRAPVPVRGTIYDRSGNILATDTDLYDLSAWKPGLDNLRMSDYSGAIASVLGDTSESWEKLILENKSSFFYLAKRISGENARSIEKLIQEKRLAGLRLDRVAGRIYPEKDLAAQLIGFTGIENIGLAGAEASFENILRANPSEAQGNYAYGNSVWLTIDINLQYHLEELCREALEEHKAEAVLMVAMEAKTGQIVAYVSQPGFDPNRFLEVEQSRWTDRLAIYAYEPGSVFKVFSMAGIMALGGIDQISSFYCDGSYLRAASSTEDIRINCLGQHGWVNIIKILEYSCNAGAAYASDTVSSLDFYAKMREFGFGERSGADLAGESSGLLRQPAQWSLRTKPTIAMGQEILVTALQMSAAATTLANRGYLLKPRTLLKITDSNGRLIEEADPVVMRRVLDETSAAAILSAMEAVVLDSGTGRRARIEDLRMSVKTGTAQMIDPATKKYSDTDFIASTLALFPGQDPEYIVYTAIIKPRGESFYGGRIAAPLVRSAAEIIANFFGVERSTSQTVLHSGSIRLVPKEPAEIGELMPDLEGYPKRLLTPLLSRTDITVEISGEGWVVRQIPAPGSPIKEGTMILLELE